MSQPTDRVITGRFIIMTPSGLKTFATNTEAHDYLAKLANPNITMPTNPNIPVMVPPPGHNFLVLPNQIKMIPQFEAPQTYDKFWKSSAFKVNARIDELKEKGYRV